MEPAAYDVFISYRSTDLALAVALDERLRAAGFSVWFDKARLQPGFDWHREIEAGCEASRIMLPILTPEWQKSEWTRYETYGAARVIPLLFEGEFAEVAPPPLQRWQCLDVRQADAAAWDTLLRRLREELARPQPQKAPRFASPEMPPANPYFVGREALLLEIHEQLHQAPSAALTQVGPHAVAGLGGVGKTTLARQYAEKFWRLYDQVLWVRADRPLALEFQRLAVEMGLVRDRSQDPAEDASRALRELGGRTRRLLVLDNAPDQEAVLGWVPKGGECRTLITSRFTGWSAEVRSIHVWVLEPQPARELLLKRSGRPDNETERDAADRLAKELGYLPLALEQAAAYVQQAKITFDRYREHLGETRTRQDLLARRVLGSTEYPESVATTWLVTVERLNPLARAVLDLAAFLAPDAIPRDLVRSMAGELAEALENGGAAEDQGAITDFALEGALAELARYSLIALREESFAVHRLVQTVQRDGMEDGQRRAWKGRAVDGLANVFPAVEFASWHVCERLLPHARVMARWLELRAIETGAAARMLNRAALYMYYRAQLPEAEPLLRRALEIYERALGPDDSNVAGTLNNLAGLLNAQKRYGESEALFRRALAIFEHALGPKHRNVALGLSNLAGPLREQGRYREAERLARRAVSIYRRALGPGHPLFATSLNNLAVLLREQGRYAGAEPLCRRALRIREQKLGPEHPDVAGALNNLAELLEAQGKYAEAEPLYRRALATYDQALGPGHPDAQVVSSNLARLLQEMGGPEGEAALTNRENQRHRPWWRLW